MHSQEQNQDLKIRISGTTGVPILKEPMITREQASVTQWQNAMINAVITLHSDFAEAAVELSAVRNGREEKAKKGLS